jgi:exopolyphosphatase / guanosine-5'-triphosphate,3'-diphosphate pyrophosphatase
MTTVAAVDCGTNSIKLLVGELRGDDLEVLVRTSEVVRLGQGVDSTGRLSDEALERTLAAVDAFAGIIREHDVPPGRTRMCATSASRDADNADVFVAGVRDRLGVAPEVLTGDEEAALVFAGAAAVLDPEAPAPVLVVDIGGGSTELVLGSHGTADHGASLDIGSVRLTERHLPSDPVTPDEVAACVAAIDETLDAEAVDLRAARTVVGTSGSIKTIAAGVMDLPAYDRDALDGAVLGVERTLDHIASLVAMTVEQRRALPWMHPGRADVIGAGALIWGRLLERVHPSTYVVSEADILHGIARSVGRE